LESTNPPSRDDTILTFVADHVRSKPPHIPAVSKSIHWRATPIKVTTHPQPTHIEWEESVLNANILLAPIAHTVKNACSWNETYHGPKLPVSGGVLIALFVTAKQCRRIGIDRWKGTMCDHRHSARSTVKDDIHDEYFVLEWIR
jgi:hypothetical protein